MSVVFTRIDNRLIHGQVIEAWLPYVKADCIVVANDSAAAVAMRKKIMRAAVPSKIDVYIEKINDIVNLLRTDNLSNKKILLLFSSPKDVMIACQLGLNLVHINLGNISSDDSTVSLTCTIALNHSDITILEQLEHKGISITSQCVPSDSKRDWKKLIK